MASAGIGRTELSIVISNTMTGYPAVLSVARYQVRSGWKMDLSMGVKNESANYANWRELERRKLFEWMRVVILNFLFRRRLRPEPIECIRILPIIVVRRLGIFF